MAPVTDDVPVNPMLLAVQVSTAVVGLLVISRLAGGVIFCVTLAEAVEAQPFVELVAVTIYVPGLLTLTDADDPENPPGPLQLKLTLPVEELAVRTMLGLAQVRSVAPVLLPIERLAGVAVFCATNAVSVAVHPPAVTVSV